MKHFAEHSILSESIHFANSILRLSQGLGGGNRGKRASMSREQENKDQILREQENKDNIGEQGT